MPTRLSTRSSRPPAPARSATEKSGSPRSIHWSGCGPVSETQTPSDRAHHSLDEIRAGVLRQPGLVGQDLRHRLTDAYDGWLRAVFEQHRGTNGIALVAVGGLGRREPAPYADLDLVLLHTGRSDNVADIADSVWYPIWDSKVGLDHSVRTPDQAISIAKSDVKAMLALLDMRHITGDPAVSGP